MTIADEVEEYEPYVDYLLFDTGSKDKWGGTGQTFDWALLNEISRDTPFFLSGGLNAGNIQSACQTVHPYAVDLSNGLESEPGVKDFDKIEQFMSRFEALNANN